MIRIFIAIFCFLINIDNVLGQDLFNEPFANRKITRIARKNTHQELDLLTTKLKARKNRLRDFELSVCKEDTISNDGNTTWTPAGNFPVIYGCPGIFTYSYIPKGSGSRYTIRFFYDEYGKIIDKEVGYIVVVF